MSLCTLLWTICLLLFVKNGYCLYMGNEEFLRQNIADLYDGKLKFAGSNLPFDENQLCDTTPKNHSNYDFIIIGAGSAGATIASRLSEVKNVSVLLIEAGDKEYSLMDIPSLAAGLRKTDEINWNYTLESSNTSCLGKPNRQCNWPRGKVVGGSSVINYMNAMRGNRRDYDGWSKDIGDESWSYENMLKYFKKLEDFHSTGLKVDEEYHHKGGPMPISGNYRSKLAESFIKAGIELNYSRVDHNGREQIGFDYRQSVIYKGERWSVNRAYLRPAKHRKNLHLTRNSHVLKILINDTTRTAYGVRYSKNGKIYEVKADKEVILSAGAINSPQLLMLSGIGPKKHLRELNINLIKDLPVGENLIDHIGYDRKIEFLVNDSSTIPQTNILDKEDPTISNYLKYRNGTLSYGTSVSVVAYLNLDDRNDMHPNIELILSPGRGMIFSKPTASDSNKIRSFSLSTMILRPKSRGKILLRSINPFDKPKIYANYLKDPEDVRVMTKAIRMAIKIGETKALKSHGAEYQTFSSPCDIHGKGSDKYWECELRLNTAPMYHAVGTCKMGRENDSSTVVNSRLKVLGIRGLRVIDASIMPTDPCGHINIPVIAVAERAADLIKMDHLFL